MAYAMQTPPPVWGRAFGYEEASAPGWGRAPRQAASRSTVRRRNMASRRSRQRPRRRHRQAEQDGNGAKQRQDAAAERFHPATLAQGRNPETSQPLDRERLFRSAPIFHLTGLGECINS